MNFNFHSGSGLEANLQPHALRSRLARTWILASKWVLGIGGRLHDAALTATRYFDRSWLRRRVPADEKG